MKYGDYYINIRGLSRQGEESSLSQTGLTDVKDEL